MKRRVKVVSQSTPTSRELSGTSPSKFSFMTLRYIQRQVSLSNVVMEWNAAYFLLFLF